MQPDLIRIPAAMPYLEVQRLFVTAHINEAPAVDEHGTVLGTISLLDLLRVIDQVCDDDIDASEGVAPVTASSEDLPERLADLTAMDVLSPDVVWVSSETPIARVAELMRDEKSQLVLVGDAGKLEGILTALDLVTALADLPLQRGQASAVPSAPVEPSAREPARPLTPASREPRPGFGTVIVGVDFSPQSNRALERATQLPLHVGAVLGIVHAVDGERDPPFAAEREVAATHLLEEARDRARGLLPVGGIHEVVTSSARGTPYEVIADHAHHGRAELVVVGRHRDRRFGERVVGSTADRVIRNGSVPVLVVTGRTSTPYRRPLVAVDISDSSRLALELAARLCDRSLETIDVIHVVSKPERRHATREQHLKYVRAEVASFVASVDVGMMWNVKVMFGEPRATVLGEAHEGGVDLIAIGTKGRTGLSRLLLGSLAEGVLRDAVCDVVVARLPETG